MLGVIDVAKNASRCPCPLTSTIIPGSIPEASSTITGTIRVSSTYTFVHSPGTTRVTLPWICFSSAAYSPGSTYGLTKYNKGNPIKTQVSASLIKVASSIMIDYLAAAADGMTVIDFVDALLATPERSSPCESCVRRGWRSTRAGLRPPGSRVGRA